MLNVRSAVTQHPSDWRAYGARALDRMILVCLLALWPAMPACGDNGGSGQNNNGLDAGLPDSAVHQDGTVQQDAALDPDSTVTSDGSVSTGEASELQVNLHEATGAMAIFLATLTTSPDYAGEDWDVSIVRSSPNPPTFTLGPGVTAVNLGNTQSFHEVNEAPTTGYEDDDPTQIIGTTWQDGGSGAGGFQVTGNIYVVRLADNTYAKLEVLSAQGGVVTLLVFHQADGSQNLATTP